MPVLIHQLLAVIGSVKAETDATLARLTPAAHNEDRMKGMEKTSRLAKETEDKTRRPTPPQVKKVQYTAVQALSDARRALVRQWDLALTLDTAQGAATADVTIDGAVLLSGAPVRHLVYLEGELTRLHALVAGLPVLDGALDWSTENAPPGQHRSQALEGIRTEKTPYNWHRENGTATIKEDVDVLTRDEVSEYTITVNYSGALPAERKAQLLDRLSQLRIAVKMAREEANSASVVPLQEGQDVFDWLLAP